MTTPLDHAPEVEFEVEAISPLPKEGWQLGSALKWLREATEGSRPLRLGKISCVDLDVDGSLIRCFRKTFGPIALHTAMGFGRVVLLHIEVVGDAQARAAAVETAKARRSSYDWEGQFDDC